MLMAFSLTATETMLQKTLPNGLEIVVKENRGNQSAGFFCFVKTGSSNEGKYLGCGVSHYLEHLVAGGTTKFHTENDFKKVNQQSGAYSNAYTNTYGTVFHIITHKDFADQTLANLAEQIQYCALDSFEVAREKQVILKEIVMSSTNPEDRIPERRDELIYQISNQKYPIIGYVDLFKKVTRNDLVEYFNRHYVPNNMVFVAAGNFDAAEMLAKIEKAFNAMPRGIVKPEVQPVEPPKQGSLTVKEYYDISLPKVYLNYILPPLKQKESFALGMALDLLFDKRQSPISYKLNEELKLVNYVWAYCEPQNSFNKEASAQIGLEARDALSAEKAVQIIDTELKKAVRTGFTAAQMHKYIERLEAARAIRTDDIDTEANEIGWNMMTYGIPDYHAVKIAAFKELQPVDLSAALQQHILNQGRLVYLALPQDSAKLERVTNSISRDNKVNLNKISNRSTLIHRNSTAQPVINGSLFFPLNTDYESPNSKNFIPTLNRMVMRGSLNYQPLWLSDWLEEKMAKLEISTSDNGTNIYFRCLKKDYPELEKIIIDLLKNPSFRPDEVAMLQDEIEAEYQRNLADPEELHNEFMSSVLYKDQRDGITSQAIFQKQHALTVADFKKLYHNYFKGTTLIGSFVGDLTVSEAEANLKRLATALPDGKIDATEEVNQPKELSGVFENNYPFEQVNLSINFPAPKIGDPDFKIMLVIQNILNGNMGRIYEAARGRNDLAYFAYSYYRYNQKRAFLRISSQTSLDKKDQLLKELSAVMEDLKTNKVSEDEITAAVLDYQRSYLNSTQDEQWPRIMALNQYLGLGYDFEEKYPQFIGKVTPEEILRVANKYFKNAAVFVSVPNASVEKIVK